jgi:hypothetical protein
MKEDDIEDDGEEFQLPPVELPRVPPTPPKKNAKEMVILVPDLFKE